MLKFFVENHESNIILLKEEIAIVIFENGQDKAYAIISDNGDIYQPNSREYHLYDMMIKESSVKEVSFLDVYGKVHIGDRETFVKELYDIYTKFNSQFSSIGEFYIGETFAENEAVNYDNLAAHGTCVKYLYSKLDKDSEKTLDQKFGRNCYRVILKAARETGFYLSNIHIPLEDGDKEYFTMMQTPEKFTSLSSARAAIASTMRIIPYAFTHPMIFTNNSDGTLRLVCFC